MAFRAYVSARLIRAWVMRVVYGSGGGGLSIGLNI